VNGELIPVSDLADYLFGERSARNYKRALRLVQNGSIPSINTGTRYFVTKTEVEKFLASNAQRDSSDGGA
jgi:hypothetical protein